jgi:hypothetical protein
MLSSTGTGNSSSPPRIHFYRHPSPKYLYGTTEEHKRRSKLFKHTTSSSLREPDSTTLLRLRQRRERDVPAAGGHDLWERLPEYSILHELSR